MEVISGHCIVNRSNCDSGDDVDKLQQEGWPTVFAPGLAIGHKVNSQQGTTMVVVDLIHEALLVHGVCQPRLKVFLGRKER